MLQNSIVFDMSDLPDQAAPKSISVVLDTSNLPDVERLEYYRSPLRDLYAGRIRSGP